MIRACIDANVVISHLLNPTAYRPPNRIVEAAISGAFELVCIETTLDEVIDSIRTKPYITARIGLERASRLMTALRLAGTVLPETLDHVPSLTRDPGGDYLIAHAVLYDVDILVSGDRDLLDLIEVEGVRIVSPAAFAALLDHLD